MKSYGKVLFSFLLILVFIIPLVANSKATTYYEWIQNGSFDDGLVSNNILTNYGFESSLTDWTITYQEGVNGFGNSTFAYAGSKSLVIENGGGTNSIVINQNFTAIDLGSITEISLYWKGGHTGSPYNNGWLDLYIQYNSTSEMDYGGFLIGYDEFSSDWIKIYLSNELLSNTLDLGGGDVAVNCKLKGIYIVLNDNGNSYVSIDNVFISTSSSVTQSIVNTSTFPWYCYFGAGLINPTIVTDTANTGAYSCLFTIGGGYYNTLIQDIGNLPSNNLYSLALYALDASGSGGGQIQVRIQYSDGLYSTNSYALTGSWVQYDFTAMITPDKTITKILIKPVDLSGSYIYIDDVSLLSTEISHTITYYLTMNPSTVWITNTPTGFNNMGFGQYMSIDEIANLTILRDGIVNATGSYNVTSSRGFLSGSVVNGTISFGISARSVLSNNTKETFTIMIQTDNINSTVYVDAYWYTYVTPSTPDTTGSDTINGIVALILPAGVYGLMIFIGLYVTHFKFIGLLIGLNLGTLVYMFIPNAQIWILPITLLIDVVLVIFRPKGE